MTTETTQSLCNWKRHKKLEATFGRFSGDVGVAVGGGVGSGRGGFKIMLELWGKRVTGDRGNRCPSGADSVSKGMALVVGFLLVRLALRQMVWKRRKYWLEWCHTILVAVAVLVAFTFTVTWITELPLKADVGVKIVVRYYSNQTGII